ncbi:unnamed protein product [Cylindrotheca closterium]|uniref:Peptidase C-terminal archaeal/bacterial domain-containing protein n=1 Tax=Cylindrotheca closterium TaxID=2856 RepID=A0AAD2CTM3_9STRA|nr:unnamed protein product [Cylindrotheca closterium]
MGPDLIPPTADSRSSMDDLKKKEDQSANSPEKTTSNNQMLTTPTPPINQMLMTPPPPETGNKSKESKLSLAPGSVTTSTNQRELKPPRRNVNDDTTVQAYSSERRTHPLPSGTTRASRQKKTKDQQRACSGERNGDNRNTADSNEDEEIIGPGAVAVQLRSSNDNNTISPDIENPNSQILPSASLLEAEVAPDMDAAIQRAVQDALRQRDEQMVAAAVMEAGTAPPAPAPPETNNEESIQDDSEGPNKSSSDNNEEQGFNKKIMYAGVGLVALIIVIVLGVTLSGGGDDASPTAASAEAGDDPHIEPPTLAPVLEQAPSTSPSQGDMVATPTFLPDGLSGDCVKAIPMFSSGYQAFVTNGAVTATYANEACNVDVVDRGIWFLLDVSNEEDPFTALFTVSNQTFAAKMSVYIGSSCENLQCVGQTFSTSEAPRSYELAVESGDTYFVFVAGNGLEQTGTFLFEFQSSVSDGSFPPARAPTTTPAQPLQPTENPTPPPTPIPTNPPPTLQPTPPPTLPTSPSEDCRGASIITPGFLKAISTLSGMDRFIDLQCNVRDGDRGVWFKFVPTYEATVTVTASEQNFSAKLAYFTGPCFFPVCGDVTTSTSVSDRILRFYAETGKEYYLFVGGNGIGQEGSLQLTLDAPEPPAFSYCDGAVDVSNSFPFAQSDSSFFTVPTMSNDECRIDSDDRGTWYKYVPTEDAIITMIVSIQDKSTRIAYFTGLSCENLTCGDFTSASVTPRALVFHGKPGKTYYMLVASNRLQNVGNYRIQIVESLPPENSYFTGATEVTSGYNNPTIIEDTTQFAVPSFSSDDCLVQETDRGLWYKYTATVDSITTVTLSASFGKRLSMYVGRYAADVLISLECLGQSGISVGSDRVMEFSTSPGRELFFLVSGSSFEEVGTFNLRFTSSEPPANT